MPKYYFHVIKYKFTCGCLWINNLFFKHVYNFKKILIISFISFKTECAEYRNAVKEKFTLAVGFGEAPIEKEVDKCEIASVPLVVGGENAKTKEFPHMVTVLLYLYLF